MDHQNKSYHVSVIMPCFNGEKFIKEAIQSVQAQDYTDWELIIIDDASSDNSIQVVKNMMNTECRIRLIENSSNLGASAARNEGLDEMKGEFFTFLDADDIWYPEKLRTQINFMKSRNLAFTFGSYDFLDSTGMKIGTFDPQVEKVDYDYLLTNGVIACHTVMIAREKITNLPRFPKIKMRQDYAFWLNLLKNHCKYAYLLPGEALVGYRLNKGSLSSNKLQALTSNYQVYRKFEHFSPIKSTLILFRYILKYFQRRMLIRIKAKIYQFVKTSKFKKN